MFQLVVRANGRQREPKTTAIGDDGSASDSVSEVGMISRSSPLLRSSQVRKEEKKHVDVFSVSFGCFSFREV